MLDGCIPSPPLFSVYREELAARMRKTAGVTVGEDRNDVAVSESAELPSGPVGCGGCVCERFWSDI